MTEARYQFGRVASIKASAVGQPGSRRFRLLVEAANGATAVVWLEKEQLFNLALAVKNLIDQVEEAQRQRKRPAARGGAVPSSDVPLSLEFQVGRLAIGFDEGTGLFIFVANEAEEPEHSLPRLSLAADQQMMDALADEALEVCAAGRPACPLCGAPMNSNEKHVCPKHNGHSVLGETKPI
ncbi:MAG: DUF3090 family protein [Chloroflexi bacterium]|nr:DUF3090 family protein [Chloroflexota bacterium]